MNTALQQIYQAITSGNSNRQNNVQFPQLRGRSTSRKSNVSSRNQSAIRPMKQSYASALASSKIKPALIRNVNIVGNDDKIAEVRTSLLTNTAITSFGITGVKKKGKNNYTVFFSQKRRRKKDRTATRI